MKYTNDPEVPWCDSRGILEVLPTYSKSNAAVIIKSRFRFIHYKFLLLPPCYV